MFSSVFVITDGKIRINSCIYQANVVYLLKQKLNNMVELNKFGKYHINLERSGHD